jgi:hypothetical protein
VSSRRPTSGRNYNTHSRSCEGQTLFFNVRSRSSEEVACLLVFVVIIIIGRIDAVLKARR